MTGLTPLLILSIICTFFSYLTSSSYAPIENAAFDEFIDVDSAPGSVERFDDATSQSPLKKITQPPSPLSYLDLEDNVKLQLDCTMSLGSPDSVLTSLIVRNLDFDSKETWDDLKIPSCRSLFDRLCGNLSREKIQEMMESPDGLEVLQNGECLHSFKDFSDFSLKDFRKFPFLKVSQIRDLSSIRLDVLLNLINSQGYDSVGSLEAFPEALGYLAFSADTWLLDPTIWQLFTMAGFSRMHFSYCSSFAKFLADRRRFTKFLKLPEQVSNCMSNPMHLRKYMAEQAGLLTRWAVQAEELAIYLIEKTEHNLPVVIEAVTALIDTRKWLLDTVASLIDANGHVFASSSSDDARFRLQILQKFLAIPLTWRLREALKLSAAGLATSDLAAEAPSPMTKALVNKLHFYPQLLAFYPPPIIDLDEVEVAELFAQFILLNGVKFDDLYSSESPTSERIVMAVAVRRILLALLTPSQSSTLIQEALQYVFAAPTSLNTNTFEILQWFHQARDQHAIPVLDRLIRSYGHEFNVSHEIQSILKNRNFRIEIFEKSQCSLLRLLAALLTPSAIVTETSMTLTIPFLDPSKALIRLVRPLPPALPERPVKPEELAAHENASAEALIHNTAISEHLQASLNYLQSIQIPLDSSDPPSESLTKFTNHHFRINYSGQPGIDAGGLRRTWLSALSLNFGDLERHLFPMAWKTVGRVPAPLLSSEIMSILGLLHGKALQSSARPAWFFTPRYSQDFLFATDDALVTLMTHETGQPLSPFLTDLCQELFKEFLAPLEILFQLPEEDAVEYFNASNYPSIEGLSAAEQRISFQRLLVFDIRFLQQPEIYSGTFEKIDTVAGLQNYYNALLRLFADNMLAGRAAYRLAFSSFFDPLFWNQLNPGFLHELLEPPVTTIDEVLGRVQYSRSCYDLFVIDDEEVEVEVEAEAEGAELCGEAVVCNDSSDSPKTDLLQAPSTNQKSTVRSAQIRAADAFRQIVSSYSSPEQVAAFLAFVTGCPQIPPSGLDALKIEVHCLAGATRSASDGTLTKSHECSSSLDFVASLHISKTRSDLTLSVFSSSGYGFS